MSRTAHRVAAFYVTLDVSSNRESIHTYIESRPFSCRSRGAGLFETGLDFTENRYLWFAGGLDGKFAQLYGSIRTVVGSSVRERNLLIAFGLVTRRHTERSKRVSRMQGHAPVRLEHSILFFCWSHNLAINKARIIHKRHIKGDGVPARYIPPNKDCIFGNVNAADQDRITDCGFRSIATRSRPLRVGTLGTWVWDVLDRNLADG